MVSAEAARNVVGIIGNVISFCLFLSPVPTFYRIFKRKDVEEFQFYPYVATVLNCMLWIFYGLPYVTKDNTLVVTINGVGLGLELIYLAIFCIYDKQNKGRKRIAIGLAIEVIFIAIVIVVSMLAFHKLSKRALFVGVFCDILNIMMYSSPLLIMRKVITTKSVEYMPLNLSVAGFANGCIWTAYALMVRLDVFILVSNGIGALAGAAQLILYACYYNSTPKQDTNDTNPPAEIQLQNRAAAV